MVSDGGAIHLAGITNRSLRLKQYTVVEVVNQVKFIHA